MTEDDEIIQIGLTELHALVIEDPLQGVRNGIEDHRGRSEAEETLSFRLTAYSCLS